MASAISASPRPEAYLDRGHGINSMDDSNNQSITELVKRAPHIVKAKGGTCDSNGMCEAGYMDVDGRHHVVLRKMKFCSKKENTKKDCAFDVDISTGATYATARQILASGQCGNIPGECVATYKTSKLSVPKKVKQMIKACEPSGGRETMKGDPCSFGVDYRGDAKD